MDFQLFSFRSLHFNVSVCRGESKVLTGGAAIFFQREGKASGIYLKIVYFIYRVF
jgi:hypothetical protein